MEMAERLVPGHPTGAGLAIAKHADATGIEYDGVMRKVPMTVLGLVCAAGVVLVQVGLASLWPQPAQACSFAPQPMFEVDPLANDIERPAPAELDRVEVSRGRGDGFNSCDDIGTITIRLLAGKDDQTPPEKMGYRVRILDSDVSIDDAIGVPDYLVQLIEGAIIVRWVDGASNEQAPFSMKVGITAIDLGSNEAEVELVVEVSDDGSDGSSSPLGCSLQTDRPGTSWPVVALGLLVALAWRRRGRRSAHEVEHSS